MTKVNLFSSTTHTQSLIDTLTVGAGLACPPHWRVPARPSIKLLNVYQKLPAKIEPADLFIVADFGQILPPNILKIPQYGSLCLHPSLLPLYRGASPVQQALIDGQKETGLTIFQVDEKVDHGPIIAQIKEVIQPDDTAGELYQRLFQIGGEILPEIIKKYINWRRRGAVSSPTITTEKSTSEVEESRPVKRDGRDTSEVKNEPKIFLPPLPQNHSRASYTKKLTKKDGRINWHWPPEKIERFIRALTRKPGAWSEITTEKSTSEVFLGAFGAKSFTSEVENEKRLKILKAHLEDQKLILDLVQLPGKNPISWQQFLAGHPDWKLI